MPVLPLTTGMKRGRHISPAMQAASARSGQGIYLPVAGKVAVSLCMISFVSRTFALLHFIFLQSPRGTPHQLFALLLPFGLPFVFTLATLFVLPVFGDARYQFVAAGRSVSACNLWKGLLFQQLLELLHFGLDHAVQQFDLVGDQAVPMLHGLALQGFDLRLQRLQASLGAFLVLCHQLGGFL